MKYLIAIVILFLTVNLQAQDMPGMEMPMQKKENKKSVGKVIYTCVMHPEIHSTKPGNCPKCGMKLVKEKPATSAEQKNDGMQMPKDKSMDKSMKMDNMNNMDMPKVNLGVIKTISSNTPPRIVRYDLYIRDTVVTYGKKSKRAIAVNGQIPMPTLTFTEGDTAEI